MPRAGPVFIDVKLWFHAQYYYCMLRLIASRHDDDDDDATILETGWG